VPATPVGLSMTSESATVQRSSKAFSITEWAMMAAAFADTYGEAARQLAETFQRRADKACMDVLMNPAGLPAEHIVSVASTAYGATQAANGFGYDALVNAKMVWGDEGDNLQVVGMHSKLLGDLYKTKDTLGHPMFTSAQDGSMPRFLGVPVKVSDRILPTYPTSFAQSGAGPAITLSGTPVIAGNVWIKVVAGGARGTATVAYSLDGGNSYSATVATAATLALGASGLTAAMPTGTYVADEIYKANAQHTVVLAQKGAAAFWYNGVPSTKVFYDNLTDSHVAAIHSYWLAHRYSRLPGKTKPGVVLLRCNSI